MRKGRWAGALGAGKAPNDKSTEGSPRVQTGLHGLQCPRREREAEPEKCWGLRPQEHGARQHPGFGESSGLSPVTLLPLAPSSPADSRAEALLDLPLVPVCAWQQILACIWVLFLNTQACAHKTNGRQRLKDPKRHELGIPSQCQGKAYQLKNQILFLKSRSHFLLHLTSFLMIS